MQKEEWQWFCPAHHDATVVDGGTERHIEWADMSCGHRLTMENIAVVDDITLGKLREAANAAVDAYEAIGRPSVEDNPEINAAVENTRQAYLEALGKL